MRIKNFFLKNLGVDFFKDEEKPAHGAPSGLAVGIINQKGGCGKTTTVINLSACLAESGKKVLIVDMDPQGHATLGLGLKMAESEKGMYHVLANQDMHISSVIKNTYHPALQIAPSNSLLASAQVDLINIVGRETILRHKISAIRQKYDFIIIDCPPSLNLLTVNALVAVEKIIIPVQTHFYSLDGMSELFKTIDIVKQRLNPGLEILGILPTLFDKRAKVQHRVLQALKDYFREKENNIKVFESVIHNCVSLTECPIYGKPVIKHRPKSRGSNDYRGLANEILGVEENLCFGKIIPERLVVNA